MELGLTDGTGVWVRRIIILTVIGLFSVLSTSTAVGQSQVAEQAADNAARQSCKGLQRAELPASAIGLPTRGAFVWHTKTQREGSATFCKVLGAIRSIDPKAQDIRFELNLPTSWNGKAVHFGGAVFDGSLRYSDGLKQPTIGPKNGPTPLQRGYATYGSDSGHHKRYLFLPDVVNVLNGSFGANVEERVNFSQDALKKTHDVATSLIRLRYGQAPARSFFLGSSSGGHEALAVVEHWPEDYDGVLSGYPSWDGMELVLQFIRTSQALYSHGGFLPRASTKLLFRAVLNACDSLDGIRDGLVSDVGDCHFDPATLLCSVNRQKGCLNPQQLHTVRTFATGQETLDPLGNGVRSIPGYNVLSGVNLTGSLGFLHHPERNPQILLNSSQYTIGSRIIQHFVVKNRSFNALTFDTVSGGSYREELLPDSRGYDASDFDLSRFAHHGGKLLLIHGTADAIIPTDSSVMFYNRVRATMGDQTADQFLKLYLIPGFGHGTGTFYAGMDALSALEDWLQSGSVAPRLIIQDKSRAGRGRTRPLCAYPTWPKYDGFGDPQSADHYSCASN
ncbi:hypothetical protein MMC10_011312 [Thelotrema lepadinum]|nr:hypothetical protein [Thelotrema lepadinum]